MVKDATVSYAMLKTGEADESGIQPQDFDEAQGQLDLRHLPLLLLRGAWDYIGFNLKNPILADKRVRQALSYGARQEEDDRPRSSSGFAKPQYSIYPSTSPVFTDDLPKFDFDVAQGEGACSTMPAGRPGSDGIRVKDGKRLTLRLHFNAGNKRREQIATVAQQYWKDVGVEVSVNQEEWGAFLKRVNETKDFDTIVLGWVGGYEPHGQSNIWSTGQPQNYIGYSNPQIDDLFKKGVTDLVRHEGAASRSTSRSRRYWPRIRRTSSSGPTRASSASTSASRASTPIRSGFSWNVDKWYSETGK